VLLVACASEPPLSARHHWFPVESWSQGTSARATAICDGRLEAWQIEQRATARNEPYAPQVRRNEAQSLGYLIGLALRGALGAATSDDDPVDRIYVGCMAEQGWVVAY